MKITFLTTGGTIDKDYAAGSGVYDFEIGEPSIIRILNDINPNFEFEVISILKKDSLDIDEQDRDLIYDVCDDIKNEKIIISHGTDTIIKTAKKLSKITNKTIILVGSSKPEKFKGSDASFNVGCSIGAINCIKNGVYIAMNGRIYNWDNCKKDNITGQFINL
ncbi:MAG: asparaginase domain-containing protein [Candidatus Gracilibacteria bacterium]|nr:asparaginase domain-containing protein [Candidatus Gracilibacteria bacterium]